MNGDAIGATPDRLPAEVGEAFERCVRLNGDEIRAFASNVHDFNPLHHDSAVARAAGYPDIIASGTQIGSHLMALSASHFAEPLADGTRRNGLGMGFEIFFRAVVLPDEDIELRWRVTGVERKDKLRGWITRIEGDARSARGVLIAATGTLLLWLGDRG